MLIQISSGQGPVECSVGVEKLAKSLLKEFSGSKIVSINEDYSGHGYKSCVMEFDKDVSSLDGTVLWVWKSTIRSGHQRKNWYMDVSVIKEAESVGEFDLSDCEVTTMHCGGKGGQHVNKVETGVRICHNPTGIVVTCTEERSPVNPDAGERRIRGRFLDKSTLSVPQPHEKAAEYSRSQAGSQQRRCFE